MDFENRGYKCGYFWQICGGFRVFGSGHTADNSRGITMGNPKITHDSVTKYFKVSYTLKFVKEQWVQKENFAVIIAAHLIQPQPKALPLCI